jgi:hypothetical protein
MKGSGMAARPTERALGHSEPDSWLLFLRRYFLLVTVLNLLWEVAHLPLYTIWIEGSANELLFAVVHCTAGDLAISVISLLLALILVGNGWPVRPPAYWRVAGLTLLFGVAYAIFSEWLNTVMRRSWTYSELMPVVPVLKVGLSPLAQWLVIPAIGFGLGRRWVMRAGVPG